MNRLLMTSAIALAMGTSAMAKDWTIALPKALPGGKAAIEEPLWRFFTEGLEPGDRYEVMNALVPGRIALIDLPDDKKMLRVKRRARKFQSENAAIYTHLESMGAGAAPIDAMGALRREGLSRLDPAEPLALMLIGDPVQVLAGEPGFSMRGKDGKLRIPSDAHFAATLAETPWGIGAEGKDGLQNVTLHFCTVGGAAKLTSDEEDALSRFWSLYVAARGGVLASWDRDLASCFERYSARIDRPLIDAKINADDKLLVMREIGREEVAAVRGKTVINGVEVESFNLFARKRHPTLSGVDVVTGVKYKPAEYPKTYETAWCYFSVVKNGTEIKFDLGSKSPGRSPYLDTSSSSARSAAGISNADFEAGKPACQWPDS